MGRNGKEISMNALRGRDLFALVLGGLIMTSGELSAADFTPITYSGVSPTIQLEVIGTYRAGYHNSKGAEIVAHDFRTQRLFVVNLAEVNTDDPPPPTLDVLRIDNPYEPTLELAIDLTFVFDGVTPVPTSVAVKRKLVALVVADEDNEVGKLLLYATDLEAGDPPLAAFDLDGMPDMVTFTPNGRNVLAAISEPNGAVAIVDLSRGVAKATVSIADFSAYDHDNIPAGVRVIPDLPVGASLAPEYIAVDHNSRTAWVTLEANNALAVVDIKSATITDLLPLGSKDHSLAANGFMGFDGMEGSNALDPSDKDDGINIANWPVNAMYQPDAIAAYRTFGRTYLVTANEGNDFDDEKVRAAELGEDGIPPLCADAPAAPFMSKPELGRLKVSLLPLSGFNPDEGCLHDLYSFGARSISIWSSDGELVFDSGYDIEMVTAIASPDLFNADDNETGGDAKSDDSGPEPEGVTVGRFFGRSYAFAVLERTGGIMVYNVTNPYGPRFEQYINNRNPAANPKEVCGKGLPEDEACANTGDLGPEGIMFIPWWQSPIHRPLVVVANETSSSTTIYGIDRVR